MGHVPVLNHYTVYWEGRNSHKETSGGCKRILLSPTLLEVWLFLTPWTAAYQASLSSIISQSLLKLLELVMPSNHLIFCHPLLLLFSVFSSIRILSSELALRIRWLKYWSFSFSIQSFQLIFRLISFRIDWFDLLVFQGTLKSLLHHYN